jgi:formyltetrahydrofolate hydrolase
MLAGCCCADQPGLVAAVSTFLAKAGANIVSLDHQHSTEQFGGHSCSAPFFICRS